MEYNFDNAKYDFYKSPAKSDWSFYKPGNLTGDEITLAIQGVELKLLPNIIVEGSETENTFGKTIWIKYQKVDTKSTEYFKCILSEIKGLTKHAIDEMFEKYKFESSKDFIDHVEAGKKIKGIGPKKSELILKKLEEAEAENITAEIACLIDNYNYASKLSKHISSIEQLYKNPYRWLSKLNIGFIKSDEIARNKLGITLDNKERNYYLIQHKFNQFNTKSSNYVDEGEFKEYLINEVRDLPANTTINDFVKDNELLETENNCVYLKEIFEAEDISPSLLAQFSTHNKIEKDDKNKDIFLESIANFEQYNNFELAYSQKLAIEKLVFGNNASILTGGGGTGKTSITTALIEVLSKFGFKSLLLAPTGKASCRMAECTNKRAFTIHSFVCYIEFMEDLLSTYATCERFCLDYMSRKIIIVDESSMIDQRLFFRLLKTIDKLNRLGLKFHKILFVGDPFQLPSVGCGQVLNDLIESKCFNHMHLTETFRQAKDSLIIKNANKVRNKKEIDIIKTTQWFVGEISEDLIEKIYFRFKEKYSNILDFYREFQIATITNRTREYINEKFRIKDINNKELEKCKFRVNDKVMNLENDREKDIMNGDVGIVEHITRKETTIYFYVINKRIIFKNNELKKVTWAYACTTHKLQGDQCKSVLIILQNNCIADHRLFYTAITRAKENCIILAKNTSEIFEICKKSLDWTRKTNFVKKLRNVLK